MKEKVSILINEHADGRAREIEELTKSFGAKTKIARLHLGDSLLSIQDFDAVIVSGGPMSVCEINLPQYNFLKKEADFLTEMIARKKAVLGICLGHQLLAHVLGGEVKFSPESSEVGWSRIIINDNGRNDPIFADVPDEFWSFQHHNDAVIHLPKDAINLAGTKLCSIQAVRYSSQPVWGVQFHPEISPHKAKVILEYGAEGLRKKGVDMFLAINHGFQVSHQPRRQIFYNFVNMLK